MSKFFINRPIVSLVIAILTTLIGGIALLGLPIAQFPDIVPPQVVVNTTYPGADALTVEQTIATPLEQQMSGVDNMDYMYSINANDGTMTLNVIFKLGTNPDIDQILAQMRVNQATSSMPAEVNNYGVTVKKSLGMPMLLISLSSPDGRYDPLFLANYTKINLYDEMLRVQGIGSAMVLGIGEYAMRIWLQPDKLAKLGITASEVMNAVKTQNTVNPAGKIGNPPVPAGQEFAYTVRAQGRLEFESEFEQIVIRANSDGTSVRLRDVANVTLGSQLYGAEAFLNSHGCALLALYQMPGSNAIASAQGVKTRIAELAKSFPDGIEYEIPLDTTLAITEGLNELSHTLWEALILVILVVYLFLQSWRATLIPLIAVPVALIGTFMIFPLLGFSLNTLSLFGLVLAIGLVVDDAIVVVEAVEAHIKNGLAPKDAAIKAMEEVSGPIVAITLILAAVFIPTAFIPGITGQLYQQFAITITVSMVLSAINALSLSPALAAMLLRAHNPHEHNKGIMAKFFAKFNNFFERVTNKYVGVCKVGIHRASFCVLLLGGFLFLVLVLGKTIPGGFLPEEDLGYAFVNFELPNAASLERTTKTVLKISDELEKIPGIEYVTGVSGYSMLSGVSASYSAFFFVSFKEWGVRKKAEEKYAAILANINHVVSNINEGVGFAFAPPAIPGIGSSGGFTFMLQDRAGRDVDYLWQNTLKFIAAANQQPEIAYVMPTFVPATPQIFIEVDRDKALRQGVDMSEITTTLQAFMGGAMVNYFNRFGRQWQVWLQAEGNYRKNADEINRFFVRNNQGKMVPLASLIKIKDVYGPEYTMRYNLYRSVQLNGAAKAGFSSAQAMAALERAFAASQPREMGFAYSGMSFQEQQAAQGISPMMIFALSGFIVFLLLAALYESWTLPISVLITVPVAIFGAWGFLLVRGLANDTYAQIGLIMLIGLAAKNAILIVEYAKMQHEEHGLDLASAALKGAQLRLRAILMTSFAFILGCVPLAIASGSGSISRQVMGTVVIGGMCAATGIAIFLIPAMYYLIGKLTARKK